ncbi:unnamed protein product [Arabis nemorensis]|uniref:THO1-MOS11 C-terminal domain-containing protein n=1 Tax=Arabis nemorensis TaxID=586526 RepID=A0A565AQY8_9BRAS|nr:unnamed protein product [Arabis nemorensis]
MLKPHNLHVLVKRFHQLWYVMSARLLSRRLAYHPRILWLLERRRDFVRWPEQSDVRLAISFGSLRACTMGDLSEILTPINASSSSFGDVYPVDDVQKKIRRAERFGVSVKLTKEEKRNSRAQRCPKIQRKMVIGLDDDGESDEFRARVLCAMRFMIEFGKSEAAGQMQKEKGVSYSLFISRIFGRGKEES